jgi:hypothetical protein
MMTAYTGAGGAALLIGYMAVSAVLAPLPVVDLEGVSYDADADTVTIDRTVNSDETIRAAWLSEVVNVETERTVPGCLGSGRNDFGPHEPQRQTFTMARFTTPECVLAPGDFYQIVLTVLPPTGPVDVVRSPVFSVGEVTE